VLIDSEFGDIHCIERLNAKQSFFIVASGYLLGSLTLWSNSWVLGGGNLYNFYMCRNIGPATAGPAGLAATALE